MSQERLNGLVVLSIQWDKLTSIEYKDLINNFASQNARKNKANFIRPLHNSYLGP